MRKITIFAALLASLTAPNAHAQTGDWFKSHELNARLVVGSKNQGVLQIDLADGWHTYWRIPGDSGLPPVFSWAESNNIEDVALSWPAPSRKKEYEFYTFGFSDTLDLPFTFTMPEQGADTKLHINAQIMICNDICIPHRFDAHVEIGGDLLDTQDEIIAEAKTKLPTQSPAEGLRIDSIIAAKDALVVSVTSGNGFENIDVFPAIEEDKIGLANPPEIEISEHDPQTAMMKIAMPLDIKNLAEKLQGKTLSVILKKGDQAIVKSVQY